MGTTTRLAVMEQCAASLGLLLQGTLTSSQSVNTTGFTDVTKRFEANSSLNEGILLITGGTGIGQEKRISGWTQNTATGAIYAITGGGWQTGLDTTSTYDVFLPPITADDYRQAIKVARMKIAAKGITRRSMDYSIQADASLRFTTPSPFDINLEEVWHQKREYIPNNAWYASTSGWTFHANASLTNDGTNLERTMKFVSTGSGQQSSVAPIGLTPGTHFEFFALTKSDGTNACPWQYQCTDLNGTAIGSKTNISTATTTGTGWVLQQGSILTPINARQINLYWGPTNGSVTCYTQAPNLMIYGDWGKLSEALWHTEYDGTTSYLVLDSFMPSAQQLMRLKLTGQRNFESLASDTDTISLDEPEIVAFAELAMAEAWKQFGGNLFAGDRVDKEIAAHEMEAAKLLGPLGIEFLKPRSARIPLFGALH